MFQIRHKDYGVYQGRVAHIVFFEHISDAPERGFHAFKSLLEATAIMDAIISQLQHDPKSYSIEAFNKAESDNLKKLGPWCKQKEAELEFYGRVGTA